MTEPSSREVAFGPLTIGYDDRVLVPRAWTVQQSEWVAELLDRAPAGNVLELCCGAGQIGLLAVRGSDRALVAVDLDPVACEFARANADRAGLGKRVEVRTGSMDAVLTPGENFAVVVADPPWVPTADIGRYPDDPRSAIDGGEDGLALVWSCVQVMTDHLVAGGLGVLQVGTDPQADRVRARLERAGKGLRVIDTRRAVGGTGVLVAIGRPQ